MIVRATLLWLVPLLAAPQGEVEIEADLNRQVAQVGETVLLTVTIRAPGVYSPEIQDPDLPGFEVLSVSDRSIFRFTTTLGAIREFTREYTLRAREVGRITIPRIVVSVDGTLHETDALHIAVDAGELGERVPSDLAPRPEEEVAVRLWVEPDTAYVGQQVTLTVAAFFDPLVRNRLQRQPEYRPPEVQGFWATDLPGTQRPERRVVDRREYFVQVYRRALFSLSAGTLRIPPAAVIYEIRRGLIYAPETFQVESAPAEVVVRTLPTESVPDDFAGAVGRYEAEIWFDRSDLRAGEAVNLVLEVEGTGNLNALGRPALPDIPGVRVYEGGEDAEVQLRGAEFAGHKRFAWVLVPERPGEYVLPGLRFPYFDPETGAYHVARTEAVSLLVESAPASAMAGGAPRGTAIRYIKDEPGGQAPTPHRWPLFWAVQAIPVIALLVALAGGRLRGRGTRRAAAKPAGRGRALRDLRQLAESGDPAFFSHLRASVLAWLAGRLHVAELASGGLARVQHTLEDAGVPPDVALEVIELLETCARARYAPEPGGAATSRELLQRAERLLAQVDREAVSERRLRTTPGGWGAIAVLVLIAASPASAAQGQPAEVAERWFADGVGAYSRGDHARAAELFDRVLSVRPRDANALYNLGNAHYERGERGKAVAYWIRALRVRPRDRDARYNLRVAVGDDPVVGSALPPLPLSKGELAMLFAVLWFSGFVALLARVRWRRGYLTALGGGALVLSLLSAVLILFPRADYAVIAGADSVLRAGPVRQSEVVAAPPPGTGYMVREVRDDWVQITRGSDGEGWIERDRIELID